MNTVTVTDNKKTFTFDVYSAPASFEEWDKLYSKLCKEFGSENVNSFEDEDIEDEDSSRIEKMAVKAAGVELKAGVITVWKH